MKCTAWTRPAACGLVLLVCLISAPAARAHEGPARLELNASRLNPGATLEVRGINIASETQINIVLVGDGSEYVLGAVEGDEHGDFTQAFILPREVPTGAYLLHAIVPGSLPVVAPLVIEGAPVALDDEGGLRNQSEPLLATLPPAGYPDSVPAQTSTPAAYPVSGTDPAGFRGLLLPVLGLLVLIGLAAVAARRLRAAR